MRKYIDYEEFYDKLVNHLPNGESWRINYEDSVYNIRNLTFAKHMYEAENGCEYPFIVYSYPMTLDASIIQEDIEDGWDMSIESAWNDITISCGINPFIEV